MKNEQLLIIIIFIITYSGPLKAQSFEWAKQMSGNSNSEGYTITADLSGNVITAGDFSGTIDFDPGPGTFNLSSMFGDDIFISKLDAAGNFVWARQFAGPSGKDVCGVVTDSLGNVYTAGWFTGTVDFDPGPGTYNLTSSGFQDIFISKLNASGSFVWALKLGSIGDNKCFSIATDVSGNIYTTGIFRGTVDFDPGPGTYNLSAPMNQHSIFICKMDNAGNLMWAKNMNGTSTVLPITIATDFIGNVYAGGSFYQTVDFDPGPGIFNLTSAGETDIYICKLDNAGNFVWAKRMGGISEDLISALVIDASGYLSATGFFTGTSDFDPGPGIYNFTASGAYDSFIVRIDPFGNLLWAKQLTATPSIYANSITIDAQANILVAGSFWGTADFNPDSVVYSLTTGTAVNTFICKLNASGNFVWAKQFTGVEENVARSIVIDGSGNVLTTGRFRGSVDFDPGPANFYMGAFLSKNVYIHKLGICTLSTSVIAPIGCNSYTSPSGNYTWVNSGSYNDIILNSTGCDSIITINLTIVPVDTSVSVTAPILTSNASGAIYQWILCGVGAIPGANSQSYAPSVNGSYAVVVTQNGCTDTSTCFLINNVSTNEIGFTNNFTFYPNPSTGLLNIEWDEIFHSLDIVIYDQVGRVIHRQHFKFINKVDLILPAPAGIYTIELIAVNNRRSKFIIVKK